MRLLLSTTALAVLLVAPAAAQGVPPRLDRPVADDAPPHPARYQVVINHEEQYAVWPAGRPLSQGWVPTDASGTLAEAHAYIEEVWTDMRPLSLRRHMERLGLSHKAARYQVVINHEEQYALALADAEVQRPWRAAGRVCEWDACRAYIEEVWTDMRPLSVRQAVDR